MVEEQTGEWSNSVLHSVLPAARSIAILFGFDKSPEDCPYVESRYDDSTYAITRKTLPNNFARIDLVFVNNEPAGSLLFVEIADSIFHMVGMFIKEKYRGKKITYGYNGKVTRGSIALFFLQHVMADLVNQKITVTLEVMNYNQAAYRLYERWAYEHHKLNRRFSFQLCSKQKVIHYSKVRSKRIAKWHRIGDGDQFGVQWSHVPDYNGEATYSISRVYCSSPDELAKVTELEPLKNRLKMLISSVIYGNALAFIRYTVFLKRKK